MHSKRAIAWIGGVVGLLVVSDLLTERPGIELQLADARDGSSAATALRAARHAGNHVVSCRDVVGAGGRPAAGNRRGSWHTVGEERHGLLVDLGRGRGDIVVFVHGYNTGLSGAILAGDSLLKSVARCQSEDDPAEAPCGFLTFCWRGDFGPEHFGTSDRAAVNSAASLADLVRTLRTVADGGPATRRLVVVSHSLGARVVLEAMALLWEERPVPWIDRLLLCEPAIRWSSLGRGEYWNREAEEPDPRRPGAARYVLYRDSLVGEYAGCLRAARRIVVTMSDADVELRGWFHAREKLPVAGYVTPDVDAALGTPVYRGAWRIDHPDYRELDLSPGRAAGAAIRGHSDLFRNRDLVCRLWGTLR